MSLGIWGEVSVLLVGLMMVDGSELTLGWSCWSRGSLLTLTLVELILRVFDVVEYLLHDCCSVGPAWWRGKACYMGLFGHLAYSMNFKNERTEKK
jgi:hypothetical protein